VSGPKCCAEAYTVASVSDPDNRIVSACVSIAPMLLTADENVQPGEVESGWFHITGFFQGGEVRVMVNESSAYYSQSTYSASASAGPRMAGDSIRPYNKPATFWLAASLPFLGNGDLDLSFADRHLLVGGHTHISLPVPVAYVFYFSLRVWDVLTLLNFSSIDMYNNDVGKRFMK
jgi:hypothetical protein